MPGHTTEWADLGTGQGLTAEAGKACAMVLTLRSRAPGQGCLPWESPTLEVQFL